MRTYKQTMLKLNAPTLNCQTEVQRCKIVTVTLLYIIYLLYLQIIQKGHNSNHTYVKPPLKSFDETIDY